MPGVALDLDEVRVLRGGANVVLSDDDHLVAGPDAETTLCGAEPADDRPEAAVPLGRLVETFEQEWSDAWDEPEDPSRDLMVARWATESRDLCADCEHVLRMGLDHHCVNHVEASGSPGWSDDRCYDPRYCGLCGHTFERVLTFSHRIDGTSGYPLDELPDEDADVPLAGE